MSLELPLVSINGVFGATLSVMDRGFSYGDGLFETCRYNHGSIPLWNYHRARLLQSASRLSIFIDETLLNRYLEAVLVQVRQSAIADGVIKITITRGMGVRGSSIPEGITPTYVVVFFAGTILQTENYCHGVNVRICDLKLPSNPSLAGIKHLNRLDYVLARLEWSNQELENVAEGILLDTNAKLVEGTVSNLFFVKNRKLFTPDLSSAGVAGIMRRLIMDELAPSLSIEVVVDQLDINFLLSADEMFLCNSVFGIWPVKKVSGMKEYILSAESVTRQLQHALEHDL